jgi:hypothetical protein
MFFQLRLQACAILLGGHWRSKTLEFGRCAFKGGGVTVETPHSRYLTQTARETMQSQDTIQLGTH